MMTRVSTDGGEGVVPEGTDDFGGVKDGVGEGWEPEHGFEFGCFEVGFEVEVWYGWDSLLRQLSSARLVAWVYTLPRG